MPKASITLSDGTVISVDGTTDEIERLLNVYRQSALKEHVERPTKKLRRRRNTAVVAEGKEAVTIDHTEIVNLIKMCDEAEAIETQILDRASQVDRTLLPLYVVDKYLDDSPGLTSGDVKKITADLGIPISTPNASRTLSGTAKRYVMGDKVRKQGQPVRYKLTRRGKAYLKDVLKGAPGGDEK